MFAGKKQSSFLAFVTECSSDILITILTLFIDEH